MVFKVIENGVENYYETTATTSVVSKIFKESIDKKELVSYIEEDGYEVNVLYPSVTFNFDE